MSRLPLLAAGATVLAGGALWGASPAGAGDAPTATAAAGAPQRKTVRMFDNYYEPARLTVNRGSTITWKWPDDTGDTHDVKLEKGPRKAKRFQSPEAGVAYSWKRKFTVPGKYLLVCTLHEEMTMTLRVRR